MSDEYNNTNEIMIQIEDLHISFGPKKVIEGINLSVKKGESLVVLGGSGTGKSVLMKAILGLIKPTKGRVLIEGRDINKISVRQLNKIRLNIGMMFQEGALFDSLNVFDNIAFGITQHKMLPEKEIPGRVDECLQMVGLPGIEHLQPSELSGGMRKRVALARAIAYFPDLIAYDEPTSGLDPIMAGVITKLIHRLNTKLKVTSLTITHDLKCGYIIADRIAFLGNGVIIEEGTPDELFSSKNPYVKQFVTGSDEGPMQATN
jgi:phospholipid/cholesterol/gamma-HCH transport system ATP-binding protein